MLASAGSSTVPAAPLPTNAFWFRGLQAGYLSGGQIPTDSSGNLVAMDGVLVSPSGGSFSAVTTDKAVLLPFQPGDDGYSPIVRLHEISVAKLGDVTGVCPLGVPSCPSNYVSLSDPKLSKDAFNTILIAASPQ